jgi:hypothetical protein
MATEQLDTKTSRHPDQKALFMTRSVLAIAGITGIYLMTFWGCTLHQEVPDEPVEATATEPEPEQSAVQEDAGGEPGAPSLHSQQVDDRPLAVRLEPYVLRKAPESLEEMWDSILARIESEPDPPPFEWSRELTEEDRRIWFGWKNEVFSPWWFTRYGTQDELEELVVRVEADLLAEPGLELNLVLMGLISLVLDEATLLHLDDTLVRPQCTESVFSRYPLVNAGLEVALRCVVLAEELPDPQESEELSAICSDEANRLEGLLASAVDDEVPCELHYPDLIPDLWW